MEPWKKKAQSYTNQKANLMIKTKMNLLPDFIHHSKVLFTMYSFSLIFNLFKESLYYYLRLSHFLLNFSHLKDNVGKIVI